MTVKFRVVKGEFPGKTYPMEDRTACTIGRSDDCMLRLPNNPLYLDVSRRHCLVQIDPNEVRVRDLGSRNGTYVNGALIGRRDCALASETPVAQAARPTVLHDGDELRVGGTVFRVCILGNSEGCDDRNPSHQVAANH